MYGGAGLRARVNTGAAVGDKPGSGIEALRPKRRAFLGRRG
jgi:hypothetical protein